jgi:peptide deformylase
MMMIGRFVIVLWILEFSESLSVVSRRDIATSFLSLSLPFFWTSTTKQQHVDSAADADADTTNALAKDETDIVHDGFQYSPEWTGTRLPVMTLETASHLSTWTMGRWPDAVLRRPASPVDYEQLQFLQGTSTTDTLQRAANALTRTARQHHAVGLAAQQCGVDASMVYLKLPALSTRMVPQNNHGVVLINPVIVRRSPEAECKVWTETCLVLPPTFRATVLRDAWVDVAYQTVEDGSQRRVVRLYGETARAAQHELDHDRGILTLDHVDLEEMENDVMRSIERDGHDDRQRLAYSR